MRVFSSIPKVYSCTHIDKDEANYIISFNKIFTFMFLSLTLIFLQFLTVSVCLYSGGTDS